MHNNNKILIIKDRLETFKDFTINLVYYINHYYLDNESLSDKKDMLNHFNFCFDKVCDLFLKENISFKNNENLRKYFWDYYYNQYYSVNSFSFSFHLKFWKSTFDLKSKNDIPILLEIYEIFNDSLKSKKLEIV